VGGSLLTFSLMLMTSHAQLFHSCLLRYVFNCAGVGLCHATGLDSGHSSMHEEVAGALDAGAISLRDLVCSAVRCPVKPVSEPSGCCCLSSRLYLLGSWACCSLCLVVRHWVLISLRRSGSAFTHVRRFIAETSDGTTQPC
jgi:hypothetical protein